VGKLGDDDEGRFCLKRLEDFGVKTDFIEIVKGGKTPVAYVFITTHSGARSIIYERNALPKIKIDARLKNLVTQTGIALLDPEVTYLGRQLKEVAGNNVKVIYDSERWRDGIEDIMNTADYFIPSSEFLTADELQLHDISFNQKILRLNNMVSGNLIVTHGEKGAYYVTDDTLYHVAAPEIKAVDTVGAGDNFHAAFAMALAKGYDLHQMVKFSVAVASLSCREYGGRNGIPVWSQALAVTENLQVRGVESI
jgi:sugar/nucleoside kinase (ribokinase family)